MSTTVAWDTLVQAVPAAVTAVAARTGGGGGLNDLLGEA